MKNEKKTINIGNRVSYFYIKNIKKWMFCPDCKTGKMTFNKRNLMWICEDCGYHFSEEYFLDDCVFWFCDECETYLNNQVGFDKKASRHICSNCGYENDTTFDNIKGICSDCGKVLQNMDATLCVDCKQVRREKAKRWISTASKVVGIVTTVAGVAYLLTQSDDERNSNFETITDRNDDTERDLLTKDFICIECGHLWSMTEDEDGLFGGYGIPRCPICGGLGCDPNDYTDYTCKYCGYKWRQYGNGGLVLGCVPRCPSCRC